MDLVGKGELYPHDRRGKVNSVGSFQRFQTFNHPTKKDGRSGERIKNKEGIYERRNMHNE